MSHSDDTHRDRRAHDFEWEAEATAVRTEMESEVLAGLIEQALDEVVVACAGRQLNVRRVLDLGCGPGVATTLIAGSFPRANVVAADGSAAMLEHARARSRRFHVDQRVSTHRVDLPAGLDALEPADVIWASMVLHHVGNEVAALCQIRALLEPGGLLALVEHGGGTRVLPDDADVGPPGLWERLDEAEEAWFRDMRTGLPDATESASHV
ncbi:MAG: class I SAM-dependent methyltransferase, partial [Acidimicrobiales bacterium]